MEMAFWIVFALISYFAMPYFADLFSDSKEVIDDVIVYGRMTGIFSFGLFLESGWTKVIQADGDMKTPMFAQIAGAVMNIALDPVMIFGLAGFPAMGIAEAAIATVLGRISAAAIVAFKGFRKVPVPNRFQAEHPDAGRLHRIHIRPERRFGDFLRRGGYRFGALLQVADLLLHPPRGHAGLHSTARQLQFGQGQQGKDGGERFPAFPFG